MGVCLCIGNGDELGNTDESSKKRSTAQQQAQQDREAEGGTNTILSHPTWPLSHHRHRQQTARGAGMAETGPIEDAEVFMETLPPSTATTIAPRHHDNHTVIAMASLHPVIPPRNTTDVGEAYPARHSGLSSPAATRVTHRVPHAPGPTGANPLAASISPSSCSSSFAAAEEAAAAAPMPPHNPFRVAAAARITALVPTCSGNVGSNTGGSGDSGDGLRDSAFAAVSTPASSCDVGALSLVFDAMQPPALGARDVRNALCLGSSTSTPNSLKFVYSSGQATSIPIQSSYSLAGCAALPGGAFVNSDTSASGLRQGASNASISWEDARHESTGGSFMPLGGGSAYSLFSGGAAVVAAGHCSGNTSVWTMDASTEHPPLPPLPPPPPEVGCSRGAVQGTTRGWRMPQFHSPKE